MLLALAAALLLSTTECFASETWKVVVYFNPEENLDSIRVYSKSASLISPNLYNAADDIQCAVDGSNDLRRCAEALCDLNSDCFSSPFDARVGVLLPQSGDFEKTGKDMLKALQFGVNYFGEQFPRIQLIAADTESDPDVAFALVKEMYASGIRIFIGPVLSSELVPILEWSNEQEEVPLFISPGGTSTRLDTYSNLFRLLPDNAHQSIAICAYIAALANGSSASVYAVVRNDAYGSDLFDRLLETSTSYQLNMRLVTEYEAADINSSASASSIISQLINQIQSDSDNEQKLIIFISFEEIQYFLEAAEGTDLENYRWLAVDVALNSKIVSSPAALKTARSVGLYTPQYSGSRVENGGIRYAFFQGLQSETVSLLAPFAFDSLLLLFNTMQYIEDTSAATIQAQIEFVSTFLYGVSGWLKLDENMRLDGEYAIAMIVPESPVLPSIWGLNSRIRLIPFSSTVSGPGKLPYSLVMEPYPLYPVSSSAFGCSAGMRVNARYYDPDFAEVEVNFVHNQGDETIGIPSYGNITLEFTCDSQPGTLVMACPGAGDHVACVVSGNSISNAKAGELTSAIIVCGVDIAGCIGSAGWLCAIGAAGCAAAAANACCTYYPDSWCCYLP